MKISDNPYKPGTSEFRDWELNLIQHQRTDTVDRQIAISIADRRLAQLKLQVTPSQRSLALEDLLASLPKPGEEFTFTQLMIQEVNTIWAETKLGVEHMFYLWIPQVMACPDWATRPALYKILFYACGCDLSKFHGLECDWPIIKPISTKLEPENTAYCARVRTTFLKHTIQR
jgi:hypothetical protein